MMRENIIRGILNVCVAAIAWLIVGCGVTGCNGKVAESAATPVVSDSGADASAWADSVMGTMSAEERAAQLVMPALYARDDDAELRLLREYACSLHVGGIVLLKGTLPEARTLADSLARWSTVLPLVAIDGEWGLSMRLSDAPRFPANRDIDPAATENALYDYGYEMARECRAAGINMLLGPVVDVLGTDRPQGGLGYRSFGDDPERVARFGVAYSRGVEDGNVISVAKHFPGHGRATSDSHRNLPVIDASRAALDTTDLLPFKRYSEVGLSGIMTGHLSVPALDASGRPATVSDSMLNGVLRKDIGFKGLIITDAMNMGAVASYSASDAVKAGADIVLAPVDTKEAIASIALLDSALLADRCRRVLIRKYRLAGPLPARAPLDSLSIRADAVSSRL